MQTTFPELRDRTRGLIAKLKALGVVVPKSSRLPRYLHELEMAASENYRAWPDHVVHQRHRLQIEIDDLEQIVTSLNEDPAVPGWKGHVIDALKGRFLWTEEANHSRARDIQFELLLAAVFRTAGFNVSLGPTDVVVEISGDRVAVEAKRPRTETMVAKNVKEAGKQIYKSGLPGIIAIDASVVMNWNDKHLRILDFNGAVEAIARRTGEAARHMAGIAHARFGDETIFALLTRASFPTWQPQDRTLGYIQRWSLVSIAGPRDRHRPKVECLYRALQHIERAG